MGNSHPVKQKVLVIFLLLAIFAGNSIVLVAVAVSKRKSRMNFFIKQLAFAGKNPLDKKKTKQTGMCLQKQLQGRLITLN